MTAAQGRADSLRPFVPPPMLGASPQRCQRRTTFVSTSVVEGVIGGSVVGSALTLSYQMWGITPVAAALNFFNGRERLLSRGIKVNDLPTAAEELEPRTKWRPCATS
jgi:hypothetical protein